MRCQENFELNYHADQQKSIDLEYTKLLRKV